MTLSTDLTSRLVCPKCHGKLADNLADSAFDCAACGLRYEVQNGVPNFLLDQAKTILPTQSKTP